MEHIWILVEFLGHVVVTRLNENFIAWQLETDLLVVCLETNSREDLCGCDKDCRQEIIEPSTSVRNVVTVLLRHGVRPVGHFLQQLLKHNERLSSTGELGRFVIHILKNFNHRWAHDET